METNLWISSWRDIGVTVTYHRDNTGHLDDDLMPGELWDSLVASVNGCSGVFACHGVKEILMKLWHLFSHVTEIVTPFFSLSFINRRQGDRFGLCCSSKRTTQHEHNEVNTITRCIFHPWSEQWYSVK